MVSDLRGDPPGDGDADREAFMGGFQEVGPGDLARAGLLLAGCLAAMLASAALVVAGLYLALRALLA